MNNLTPSKQHYINAIYELSSACVGVRISDIAEKLGIKKSSVSVGMKFLEDIGLVYRDHERLVFLTEDGERQAISSFDKYHVLYRFLTDTLGVEQVNADREACVLEHAVSIKTLCAICKLSTQNGKPCCKGDCHVSEFMESSENIRPISPIPKG